METSTILILLAFCCGASFVQRVSGFGFGIFVMTMFPHIMPSYGEATALSGLLSLCLALYVVIRMRKYIVIKRHLPILIAFAVVSFFAIGSIKGVDDKFLKQILGAVLILISIYFFCFSNKIKLKPTLPVQISMGALSGIMGGIFAMPGPPAVLYYIGSEDSKERYLAGIQVYFLFSNVLMAIFRFRAGFVTPAVGHACCIGIVGVVAGAFVGAKVFKRIPTPILRKVVYAYMAVSGVIALL